MDFGIAKILDPDLIHESFHPTASVVRMMTPDYASPEQVRGFEVTTVSDVYSLGVLLYELLTGHRPYRLDGPGMHELSRAICEVDPETPGNAVLERSTLLKRYSNEAASLECRAVPTADELRDILFGDLDVITIPALAKSPEDRWASVEEFGNAILEFVRKPEQARKHISASSGPSAEQNTTILKSVAVLPFKTIRLTTDLDTTDEHFFGVGLADSLISRLGRIDKFLVMPTSSILGFLGTATDPIN